VNSIDCSVYGLNVYTGINKDRNTCFKVIDYILFYGKHFNIFGSINGNYNLSSIRM
jgi:hypothetical protein